MGRGIVVTENFVHILLIVYIWRLLVTIWWLLGQDSQSHTVKTPKRDLHGSEG